MARQARERTGVVLVEKICPSQRSPHRLGSWTELQYKTASSEVTQSLYGHIILTFILQQCWVLGLESYSEKAQSFPWVLSTRNCT